MDISKLLDYGIGSTMVVLLFIFSCNIVYKLIAYAMSYSKSIKEDYKNALKESNKLIKQTNEENKKRLVESQAREDLVRQQLSEALEQNRYSGETNKRLNETIDASVRTIEILSNTHGAMLANMNDELRCLKETQNETLKTLKHIIKCGDR